MRTRRTLGKRCCVWGRALIVVIALALLGTPQVKAQEITTLIEFNHVWKYDLSGLELGTEWRTNDFDDSAWPSGPGLLGWEDVNSFNYQPYGWRTGFLPPLSQTVTTYYFRTQFTFSGPPESFFLVASNVVDDGCAIWINGRLAGGVRMPPLFTAATFFNGPALEGQLDAVSLTNFLVEGVNQLAVEVHQSSAISADVMFGMKLVGQQNVPLAIVEQPKSQTALEGDSVAFRVIVSGGPVSYRWQKDGVNISGISSNLTFSLAQSSMAGDYRVICSGPINSITSAVARLTVVPDIVGPTFLSASRDTDFGANSILMMTTDVLNTSTVRNTNNFAVYRVDTGAEVVVTNILYSTAIGVLLRIRDADPNWLSDVDYVVRVNNLKDIRGNLVVPNTEVPVARYWNTNVISPSTTWSWHARYSADTSIYQQNWFRAEYVEDPQFWFTGVGPFCGGALPAPPCGSDCETPIDYQLSPTLFRTTFVWPADLGSEGRLLVSGSVDDGMVLYLNGVEVWRTNVFGNASTVAVTNHAFAVSDSGLCFTEARVPVTSLKPGLNCLAAAVMQPQTANVFDVAFSLVATVQVPMAKLPPSSGAPPTLRVESLPNNAARISWEGNGFALEYVTNLTDNAASYPAGPWIQAPGMSNPYTNRPPSPSRIFRLKK